MKALTIWQPYASLIMIGAKPYEFRGWPAPRALRGQRIVIHAGARPVRRAEVAALINDLSKTGDQGNGMEVGPALDFLETAWRRGLQMLHGVGLGTALLGEPRRCTEIYPDDPDAAHSMWGWPVSEIEIWDAPIAMKGAQGFWAWRP
jgi:hypothetical protein